MTFQNNISQKLIELKQKYNTQKKEILIKMSLQILNNIVNGSSYVEVTPPVLTGVLRGSGSVFVGNNLIRSLGSKANTTHNADENVITVGFNTPYAARMHEELEPAGKLRLGKKSLLAGNVGGKFIEKHFNSSSEVEEIYSIFAEGLKNEVLS